MLTIFSNSPFFQYQQTRQMQEHVAEHIQSKPTRYVLRTFKIHTYIARVKSSHCNSQREVIRRNSISLCRPHSRQRHQSCAEGRTCVCVFEAPHALPRCRLSARSLSRLDKVIRFRKPRGNRRISRKCLTGTLNIWKTIGHCEACPLPSSGRNY